MDFGLMTPLFVAPGIDVANPVVARLNAAAQGILEQPTKPATSPVAVVNVGVVFSKWEKIRMAGKEIESLTAFTFRTGPAHRKETWLRPEARKKTTEQQEEHLVTIWKEVQDAVKTCTNERGTRLVIGYGDPAEKSKLEQFPNINRKMEAIDAGGALPVFVDDGVDIAEAVVVRLNRYRNEHKGRVKR
jgi:hypothetical protein